MNLKTIIRVTLLSATLFLSCKSDPVAPEKEQAITGIVKDGNGNPVADAYLNFVFEMTPASAALHREGDPDETMPSTTIRFSIPGRSHVKVTIENYVHQYVLTLVDDTLNGGMHGLSWNGNDGSGKAFYTDCYFYRLSIGGNVTVSRMLFTVDQHLATNPAAYVRTDRDGRFSIPLSRIPVNEIFTQTNASGEIIGTTKLADAQRLYAFTSTHYGVESVSLTELVDNTIVLSTPKYGQ